MLTPNIRLPVYWFIVGRTHYKQDYIKANSLQTISKTQEKSNQKVQQVNSIIAIKKKKSHFISHAHT